MSHYIKVGGRIRSVPDEFRRMNHDAEKLARIGNQALDGICIIACLLLFVAFVLGTLSLG